MQVRRKTAAEWTSTNEVLLDSEWGYEHDTGKIKIGDGVTPWAGLDYFSSGTSLSADNAGAGIVIDDTDPAVPIIINDGVRGITPGTGISVDATDPHNPLISASGGSGGVGPSVLTVASSPVVNPSFANTFVNITDQSEALTIANPTGTPINGQWLTIRIKGNTVANSITWGDKYRGVGFNLPSATIPGEAMIFSCIYNASIAVINIYAYSHGYEGKYYWWPFVRGQFHFNGDDGGSVFTDTSSFANTITVVGTPTTEAENARFGTAGLNIPNVNSYIKCNNTGFRIPPNPQFTFRFWVRKLYGSWPTGEKPVFNVWVTGDTSWTVTVNNNRQPTFYWQNPSNSISYPYCVQAIPDDTNWHFITVNCDNNNNLFFSIDGTYYNSSSGTGPGPNGCKIPTSAPFSIGGQPKSTGSGTDASWPSNVAIDEVEIIIGACIYTKGVNHQVPTTEFPSE